MGLPDSPPLRVSLHAFVKDYLFTHAYASTSRCLAHSVRAAADSAMDIDGDGDGDGAGGGGGDGRAGAAGGDGMDGVDGAGAGADADGMNGAQGADGVGVDGRREDGAGLSERALVSAERRSAILNDILNGAIDRAVSRLETYFPSVLAPDPSTNGHGPVPAAAPSSWPSSSSASYTSHAGSGGGAARSASAAASSSSTALTPAPTPPPAPAPARRTPTNAVGAGAAPAPDHATPVFATSHAPAHLRLNLRVQGFIESFRALAVAPDPASPASSFSSTVSNGSATGTGAVSLTHALTAAQGLHAEAARLDGPDRAVYLQEIKDVGALFAYAEPEKSILGGFLKQQRRIALARQVNGAILQSQGRPTQSFVERVARRTSALYALLAERDIDPQPLWDDRTGGQADWRLASLLRHTNLRHGFSLHDYVEQCAA
ncbi:hypothetical protein Q5752_003426 [Cryptotrichosporon argae]